MMTDDDALRAEIRRLAAEGDRERAEDAAWQQRYEEYQQKQRSVDDRLVYKTRHVPQQQVPAAFSPELQQRWDQWVDARINAKLRSASRALGKAVAEINNKLVADLRKEISKAVTSDLRFPVLKGWTPRLHLEGELTLCGGGLYQALRDTHCHPGHPDWQIVAAPGQDGEDGARSLDDDQRDRVIDWPRRKSGDAA